MPLYYIIIFILCILCILFLRIQNGKKQINALPFYTLEDAYNNAQQGDLVLFKWHKINPFQETVSPFTHVGMVLIVNDQKYILETHLKGDTSHMGYKDREGVNIYEFKERIKMYKGENYLLKKSSFYNINIKDKLSDYINIPFYNDYKDHFIGYCIPKKLCNSCFENKIMNSMFCSQFIGYVLQDQGLIDPSINIDCLTPVDFLYMKNDHGPLYTNLYKINKLQNK